MLREGEHARIANRVDTPTCLQNDLVDQLLEAGVGGSRDIVCRCVQYALFNHPASPLAVTFRLRQALRRYCGTPPGILEKVHAIVYDELILSLYFREALERSTDAAAAAASASERLTAKHAADIAGWVTTKVGLVQELMLSDPGCSRDAGLRRADTQSVNDIAYSTNDGGETP
jgi:hypothetical protein